MGQDGITRQRHDRAADVLEGTSARMSRDGGAGRVLTPLFVSIVMPALNEEAFIAAAIESIIPRAKWFDFELFVVDGGSTDRTREIVEQIAATDPRIKLLCNLKRLQSAGVNLAVRHATAKSRVIVRADCHALYPEDFVEICVKALICKRAASVVVPMRATGTTALQKAIAAMQNCRLGNGGALHRQKTSSRFVDHGHHAAFDRMIFESLGGYDETFACNEDAEFDARLRASGERIWLASEAAIIYFPRARLTSLAAQYFRYGAGRARTLMKQRSRPALRQVFPVALVIACAGAVVAAAFEPRALIVPASYLTFCLIWGAYMAVSTKRPETVLGGLAAVVMHLSWGLGFLLGLPAAMHAGTWRPATLARTSSEEGVSVSSLQ